jgi:hypothetical protein
MIAVWLIVGLGGIGAVVMLIGAWNRREQPGDLGVVSRQWVAEQRLGQGPDSRR